MKPLGNGWFMISDFSEKVSHLRGYFLAQWLAMMTSHPQMCFILVILWDCLNTRTSFFFIFIFWWKQQLYQTKKSGQRLFYLLLYPLQIYIPGRILSKSCRKSKPWKSKWLSPPINSLLSEIFGNFKKTFQTGCICWQTGTKSILFPEFPVTH